MKTEPFSEPEANSYFIDRDGLNLQSVTFSSASCLKVEIALQIFVLMSMSLIVPSWLPLINKFGSLGWKFILLIVRSLNLITELSYLIVHIKFFSVILSVNILLDGRVRLRVYEVTLGDNQFIKLAVRAASNY